MRYSLRQDSTTQGFIGQSDYRKSGSLFKQRRESDQKYLVRDGQVMRSQRGIVIVVIEMENGGCRNYFGYQNAGLLHIE